MKDARLVTAVFCLLVFALTGMASAAGSLKLTIDQTKVDANLAEYPVLVHLAASSGINAFNASDVFAELGSNSKKISVTNATKTQEFYVEIEKWDNANNQAWLWVNVPNISGTVDTILYLDYDKNRADNTTFVGDTGSAAAKNVWNSGYIAVYHLNDVSSTVVRDSSRNGYNGTKKGVILDPVAGKLGPCATFGGKNYIEIADNDDFSLIHTRHFILSTWFSPGVLNMPTTDLGDPERQIRFISKGYDGNGVDTGNYEWALNYYNDNGIRDQGMAFYWFNFYGGWGTGLQPWTYGTVQQPVNGWKQIVGRGDEDSALINGVYRKHWVVSYADGALSTYKPSGESIDDTRVVNLRNEAAPVLIGHDWTSRNTWLVGRLDEIRFDSAPRLDAWIKTDYYNQIDALIKYALATPDTTPPVISAITAGSITPVSASISWTTNEAADGQVEYGLTTSYGSSTALNASMVTAHTQALAGLTASTLYHYRVKSKDVAGNLAVSPDQTFTTAAPDTTPPLVSGVVASNITFSSAGIAWTTDEASDSQVEYGLTTSYGSSTILNTNLITAHAQTLSGLTASTLYHYRVKSKDASGNLAVSTDQTFTTAPPDITSPVISAVAASNLTSSSAQISWTTNETSDTQVEYGLTTSYGSLTTLNTSLVTAHTQGLAGLTASTLYHYRVKSKDLSGNLGLSEDNTFTTSVQETGLVAAWKLDENAGTSVTDASSNGITGTVSGAVWTVGKKNSALNFDGVNDYVDLGNPTSLQITKAISLEGWVKINNLALTSSLFGRGHGLASPGNQGYFLVYYAPTKSLYFDSYSTTTRDELVKSNAIVDNNWHHLVATWDGSTASNGRKLYVDGILVAQKTSAITAMGNPSYNFRIGIDSANSRPAAATIDEVKVFNRALTAQEVLAHYNDSVSDVVPPVISVIAVANISASSATISWITDEAGDTQIEYGLTASYGSSTVLDTNLATSHLQDLTGLAASTLYHYRVKSKDASGNMAISTDNTFTTSTTYILQGADLAAYWRFDETSGTGAADSSNYGNTGVVKEAVWTSGKTRGALSFDGLNDYVDAGNGTSLNIVGKITIVVWIKSGSVWGPSTYPRILDKMGLSGTGYALMVDKANNRLELSLGSTDIYSNANALALGQWQHVAVSADGSNIRFYVNGVGAGTVASTVLPNSSTINLWVGERSGGVGTRSFNGIIDEVKIYNRALTAAEIIADYNVIAPDTKALASAPSATVGLTATREKKNVALVWGVPLSDGGYPITNYNIYRGLASGSETLLTQTGDILSYQDANVADGEVYYYQVSAVNDVGEGPKSDEVMVAPGAGIASPLTDQIVVYPNPYVQGKSGREKIIFDNLGENAVVKTYSPDGVLIKEIFGNIEGKAEWDVSNAKSGVYLYVVSSSLGLKKGKISVIK